MFNLAYLREIGARHWQDVEDAYFAAELLIYTAQQLKKLDPHTSTFKDRQIDRVKIAVTVPFDLMVSQYTQVLTERLLRWFDLSNLVVGTPVQLQGHRCEIVLVCGLRNSVKAGLACYHSQLPIAMTRSSTFVWVVSAIDTLSEIDTLKPLLTFLR